MGQTRSGKHRRIGTGLTVLAGAAVVAIGSTFALNVHKADQENLLQSHTTQVGIVENFPDPTITPGNEKVKEVEFQNNGSSPVFLRVAYSETWTAGTEWLSGDDSQAQKVWTQVWTDEFEDGGDGWYYYKKVLPSGGSTGLILDSVAFPTGMDPTYAGGEYSLDFLVEAVQLSDEDSVNTAATQTVFGRSAEVENKTIDDGAVTSGTVKWG